MWIMMSCPYSLSKPGGVQGQTLGLARSLRKLGHTVTVVAPHDELRPGSFLPRGSPGEGPALHPLDGTFVVGPSLPIRTNGSVAPLAMSPGAILRVIRLLRDQSPDVIHVHEPLAPMINYAYLLSTALPVVGTFHRSGPSAWHRGLSPLARWATSRLTVRCAVSPSAAETTGSTDVEILFNGVDVERFVNAVPWPAEKPTIMFLGRHERRKGLELLLRAFVQIPGDAVLWIGGDGPESKRLRLSFPESSRIHWLGVLSGEEVASRLRGAHVLCAPSLYGESFGVVLLEGMAARCSVVASALDGHRAAAHEHAHFFPVGDQAALRGLLAEVLSDACSGVPARKDALESAFIYASRFSLDHLAERYESIYARVRR
jgi:phosphatidyl-myo-inositol alpha-mannosyltransferase